jgi:hypothetical protein
LSQYARAADLGAAVPAAGEGAGLMLAGPALRALSEKDRSRKPILLRPFFAASLITLAMVS